MNVDASTSLISAHLRAFPWIMHHPTLDALVGLVNRHEQGVKIEREDLAAIIGRRDAKISERRMEYDGLGAVSGVAGFDREPFMMVDGNKGGAGAIVPVHGVLSKYAGMINGISQPRGMTYDQVGEAVAQALAQPRTRWVLLDIDSPGGSAAGAEDLHAKMTALRSTSGKPVVAFIHDLGASGGYFVASLCDEIYATANAVIGSIASFSVIEDSSEMYAKMGVRRLMIAGGEFKGVGEDGVPVSEAQVAELKRNARGMTAWFARRALIEGRGMDEEEAAKIADGRVWIGDEATTIGLIDGVTSLPALVDSLRNATADAAA